ncbi:glycosyltransferase [Candidatus Uhrbacteria bacterium]|nr:glycosyltransferase [Candidatus Uhrbacteria bacterium]
MRILIIASLFRPYSRGGAEIVVQTVADQLKKNHEVLVLTTQAWNGFRSLLPSKWNEDGLIVYRFYPCNIFSFASIEDGKPFLIRLVWHLFALLNLHSYAVVRSVIATEKPDRIYTHNLTGIGFMVPAAVRHARVPWIHTVHDVHLAVPSGVLMAGKKSSRPGIVEWVYSAVTRACMAAPAVVVFSSRFLLDFYERRGFFSKSKKILLPNPTPESVRFRYEEYEDALHARLSSRSSEGTVFLYVGLLKVQKGLFDLLTAFSRLKDANARLIIAGTGPLQAALEKAALQDTRITFAGHMTHNEVRQLYIRSHITVVPSLLCENSPMVIQESFAAGIPVIAARSGGAAERIREGENGFAYAPGDSVLLAHALDRSCKLTNKQYETMSARAYQTVQEDSSEQYCERLLNFVSPSENLPLGEDRRQARK